MVFQLSRKKMGIITAFSSLLVFTLMAWTVNARVINKRAAFYIANETMCIVDGELYFNGDPVPTDDHCEKCTCRPPGFSCVLRDCEAKPGCKAVRKDGECCPDYICGCSHNGNVYKDGDFIRDLQNPCYTCRCHGSSISCTFADCLFRSDCGPEYIHGECCPRYDHCPPLSTTQKSTTVITTVPITYDETTKPLFNLTSPPHERLATHTTIFPTTGMITVEGGETHTTEIYEKPAVSDVSIEATHTTRGHDFTVTPSSESPTSHITHADTSTVTTFGSKTATETLSEVDVDRSQKPVSLTDETTTTESFSSGTLFLAIDVEKVTEAKELTSTFIPPDLPSEDETLSEVDVDRSQKPVSLADETTSTESFSSGTLFLATDAEKVTEAKELTSTLIPPDLSSEDDLMSQEQDGQVTEVSHDRQTEDSFTEAAHDRHTDESVTAIPHDNRVDDLETGVPHRDEEDDSETGLTSSSHTVESVTEVSHDKQTEGLVEDLPHDRKTDHASLESDETLGVTFSEEFSKTTFDDTKGIENKDISQSIDDTVESTTEMHTTHEEVNVSSEDEAPSSSEAFSNQPEVVEGSEGTSPSLVNTVTMSGDTDTELSTVKAYTIAEIDDITTHDTHSSVSDTSATEVQETTTQGILEEVADTLLPVLSSHDDHQAESEVEDKTTFSGHESDFDDSESSTVQSAIKLHLFITASTDVDDSSDEISTNEGEISTQDAEKMNLFTAAVTPSSGSQQSQTTVLDHISNLPSSEVTNMQDVTSELTEEQSVDDSKVIEDHLQTEENDSIDSNIGDLSSFVNLFTHVEGTTTTQSTEVPNSPQHTHFVAHSSETTTAQSFYTSSDIQNEPIGDVNDNDVKELLSSVVTEYVTERHSDVSQSTTENLLEQENAEIAGTVQSTLEDHEAPHLLSEGVNALSPTDEFKTQSEQIHAETEGSSQSLVAGTTEDTAETVITMEAESDLSLSISEDSSTTSGGEDVSIASSGTTEPSESLSVVSESITSTRAAETPVTVTSLPVISYTGERTTEHVAYDDVTSKPTEHELLSENLHITSTVLPEREASGFDENSDTALSTTEIPSDDLGHHSEQLAEVSSIISEAIEHVDSESGTSTASDNGPERTVTSSPEESNDGSRNDISLTTKSTTESSESHTTSPKHVTEELKPTEVYDNDENTARSAHFIKTEEQHDTQTESTLVNELTTDSQRNAGNQITENTSEITMDAEESIVNNGFESIADYLHTTENYGENFISTRQGHSSVDKEEGDTQSHYTVDSETYSAVNGEHLRVSRSTSSNNMASSITAQYPEKIELKTLHVSESENETREAPTTNGVSVSFFDNTAVASDEDKSVTESLQTETTQTAPTTVQDNSVKSTHSIYLNSVEVSSLSSDPPNENLHTSTNTDDSYVSQVTKLISYEDENPDGVHVELSVEEAEETSEDEPKEEASLSSTVEVLLSAEPTTGLFKDNNISPDLIIPVEHHVNEVPFNSPETENSILSGHSTEVAKEHNTNPPTGTPELESSETQNEDFSESNDINKASEKEDNDYLISRFSRTSEQYATDETVVDNEASASTTENQSTISSYVMDAEAETSYLDDSTDNYYKENTKHQSITYSPSSGQTIVFESDNNQTPSDSEEEELVGKEFQNGPEKGGEWFEPTVPVLSAINVHKVNDKTETSADVQISVKYSTPTDFKEAVTMKSAETLVFVTDMVDQTQKSLDNSHSSTLLEDQFGKSTVTALNVQHFTNNIDEEVIGTTSTKEEPSPTSVLYETTHVDVTDNLEHKANSHQFFHSSGPDTDQNANIPTTEEPQGNEATYIGDEINGSSYSIQTTTDITNSISHGDEIESVAASEAEHRGVPKNTELREQKEIKGEPINSSQHEIDSARNETTKKSDISVNDFMLSDGVGSIMRFTDIITDDSNLITDHVSTTESGTPDEDEDLGKGIETTSSQSEEFYTNLGPITNDEVPYVKESSVENESQESTTTKVNSNGFKESEELSSEGGHFFEKSTENSVFLGDRTDGLQHKNNEDYSTEHFSTSYFKSTTPLPLLLFNEFVEKVKEDSLLNRNSQSSETQFSTIQPDEISEVLSELVTDDKTEEDSEIQSDDNSETDVTNDHETSTTTQRNSNEHDLVSTTPTSQEKQTEIYSSSSQSVEYTSQNSYPTENVHSDHSLDETVKVTDSTASSQVTEPSTKSEKNVSRFFFIRRSHDDDYQPNKENPQNKEEHTVEKDSLIYSVKSPEISVKNPDDTNQEEHDEVSVTNEETTQKDEGSKDDTHHRDFHDNGLDATSTTRSSVEPTSTADTKLEENTSVGSSADEKFHSESTDTTQNNEDGLLEDERDNVSGPVTTPDPMNSDTTWNI